MKIPPTLRREDGAAAVEFALIAGVLAMLIFGMLQFGLAFFQLQNLRSATREGARLAAVGAPLNDVQTKVNQASLNAIPGDNGAIAYQLCPATPDVDDSARVTINLSSNQLPGSLQDIFSVDIPFVPTINITSPVYGEFRCES
jgi:Flp pilus assembly protein TadG